jgi:hypothetical protein
MLKRDKRKTIFNKRIKELCDGIWASSNFFN